MITMQMGYKDMIKARELQLTLSELQLRTFATIYHKEFIANVHNLRRREVARRW
jgi:hypothetical protein